MVRDPEVTSSSLSTGRNCKSGEWTNSAPFHPQYHDWGVLEQGTEPPAATWVLQQKCPLLRMCVHYCVCVHLDGLNAEHKFTMTKSGFTEQKSSVVL